MHELNTSCGKQSFSPAFSGSDGPQDAELDWRSTGFWPGTAHAAKYAVPEQHRRYRRLHVGITWRSSDGQIVKVPGPICIGGGKHSGLGLFAAFDDMIQRIFARQPILLRPRPVCASFSLHDGMSVSCLIAV